MRTHSVQVLVIALALTVLLTGCATTVARQDAVGMPNAQNPEYLAHPFRLAALPATVAGYVVQYVALEPFYFLMSGIPDAVGLSLDEQRYLEERKAAWDKTTGSVAK